MAYLPESGMTEEHFDIIQWVARYLNRIIVVRNTNPLSTPWIARGYPPKPMEIKSKTSRTTGKVTASTPQEVQMAIAAGYYVLDKEGVAKGRGGQVLYEKFPLGTKELNEEGQVIHPTQKKALVGDYDLLAVIDPKAMGRNLVLAVVEGEPVRNRISPDVRLVLDEVNPRMDQPRLMHGAHDQLDDLPEGGSTVFYPDRTPILLPDRDATQAFYALIRRQPITGSYR